MHPQCSQGGAGAPPSRPEIDPQEIYEANQRGLLDLLLAEFPGVLTYREALTARVDDPRISAKPTGSGAPPTGSSPPGWSSVRAS